MSRDFNYRDIKGHPENNWLGVDIIELYKSRFGDTYQGIRDAKDTFRGQVN